MFNISKKMKKIGTMIPKKIPKTEVTMTKKAKVSSFFLFDLHFCMTMPLRGW